MGREFEPDPDEERIVDLTDDEEFPAVLSTVDHDDRVEDEPEVDPEAPLDGQAP